MKHTIELPDTITFTIGDTQHNVNTSDLTDAAIVGLFMYGRRKANDTFNSQKTGKNPLSANEVIAKIKVWDFGTTGPRISPLVRAERELVKTQLQTAGVKALDAGKQAKDPQAGFRLFLGLKLAAKNGVPLGEIPEEAIQTAFENNWPKVETRAQAMVAAATVEDEVEV